MALDLNCDMGESFGAWHMGADAAVMPWITSANIACGYHAGDALTMQQTVHAAAQAKVNIGAHIGLPDLQGFGRRKMAISPKELHAMTLAQLGSLDAFCRAAKVPLVHIKPHGALYHQLEDDRDLVAALLDACQQYNPQLVIVGLAGGQVCQLAAERGFVVRHEVFADRRYQANGKLQPRSQADAVIDSLPDAVQQAKGLAQKGQVTAVDGSLLTLPADTLCIHGDRPDAAAFAEALHKALNSLSIS